MQWGERARLDALELAGATLKQEWPQYHYRIYTLATPLQPGESREVAFRTTLEEHGFPNGAPLTRVVENGTFIDNTEITPNFGPQRDPFLKDRAKRRKHGLPADLRPPKLEDDSARAFSGFRHDSDFVRADITVTTDADQTPIAPGQTLSDTTTDGRHMVHFVSDAPINHFFSIQSARYAIKRDTWHGRQGDVALAVYYHPAHPLQRGAHARGDEAVAADVQRALLTLSSSSRRASWSSRPTRTSRRASPTRSRTPRRSASSRTPPTRPRSTW